jgi:hypothetical protein
LDNPSKHSVDFYYKQHKIDLALITIQEKVFNLNLAYIFARTHYCRLIKQFPEINQENYYLDSFSVDDRLLKYHLESYASLSISLYEVIYQLLNIYYEFNIPAYKTKFIESVDRKIQAVNNHIYQSLKVFEKAADTYKKTVRNAYAHRCYPLKIEDSSEGFNDIALKFINRKVYKNDIEVIKKYNYQEMQQSVIKVHFQIIKLMNSLKKFIPKEYTLINTDE